MALEKVIYDKRPAGVGFGAGWLLSVWLEAAAGGGADREPHAADKREADPLQRAGPMCVVGLSASVKHNVCVFGIVVQLRSHFFPYGVAEWISVDFCLGDPLT